MLGSKTSGLTGVFFIIGLSSTNQSHGPIPPGSAAEQTYITLKTFLPGCAPVK